MTNDPEQHHRRSIRLSTHDYGAGGRYFITVCSQEHATLFGSVADADMQRNELGDVVVDGWFSLQGRHPWITLDVFVVMPNHFHGVVVIEGIDVTEYPEDRIPLGRLIAEFKSNSTRTINAMRGTPGTPVWQRNYYERIVRNDHELDRIRNYIHANPANWQRDSYFTW